MRPHKTEKAHSALRDRPADVSVLERRIMILSDGKRRIDEVVDLLGAQTQGALTRLLQHGYLVDIEAPASAAIERDPSGPQPIATTATAPRRSVAAAKMYIVDMLQLQRGNDAAAITASLRSCRDADELAAHVLRALRHIHAITSPGYSRRVAAQLAELMPEQYLSEFGVFRDSLFADGVNRP